MPHRPARRKMRAMPGASAGPPKGPGSSRVSRSRQGARVWKSDGGEGGGVRLSFVTKTYRGRDWKALRIGKSGDEDAPVTYASPRASTATAYAASSGGALPPRYVEYSRLVP